MGLAMLANASLPLSFWPDAFTTATYLINRLPSLQTQNQYPHELLFHQQPDYSFLKVFALTLDHFTTKNLTSHHAYF